MVRSEIELLLLKIQYPDQFAHSKKSFTPDLYLTPKNGLGIIGMAEIVLSIFLSEEIKDKSGNPASLKKLASAFEYVFNFSFGSIYDKCTEFTISKLII